MNDQRTLHTATVLVNGNVLVSGGFVAYGGAEVYVSSNRTSTTTDKMGTVRNNRIS